MSGIRPGVGAYLERRYEQPSVSPIRGDASTRTFWRVRPARGPSVVVMDYGGPFEGESDDVALQRLFAAAGLPVARILEVRPEIGFLILEDLGSRPLEGELPPNRPPPPGGGMPEALERAVRLAAEVAERGTPVLAGSERAHGPALDEARFRFEMEFFVRHYCRGMAGAPAVPAALRDALDRLAREAADTPRPVFCHRDFHSRNLLLRDDRSLAMVDIQDARWGPDAYDLASLLCDAYVDIDPAWVDPLVGTYLDALAEPPERRAFRERFTIVAAQRMLKALGTFGYQVAVLGRDRYRAGVPRTLARLRRLLPAGPATVELGERLERAGLLALR